MRVRIIANNRAGYGPVAAGLVLCVAFAIWLQVDFSRPEEWRRTAQGWERSTMWLVVASGPAESIKSSPARVSAKIRFDTHPIVLAFVQVVGTLLAFFAAAAYRQRPEHGGLLSAILRSFRASAFGS
jgi:hypothetical protein